MDKRKLLIDTDPGIDDALAIMLANASGVFDILAITTVFGNAPLNETAKNALFLRDMYGIDCKVAVGAQQAMVKSMPFDENIHGKNGLGNFQYSYIKGKPHDRWAWELLYELAKESEGELEILALGPLTNIAIALLKYPSLKDMIKKIVIMGGSASSGNVSPYAEFNIHQDPYAANIVFSASFRDLTLVDLDSCNTAFLEDGESDRMLIQKSKLGSLYETLRKYQRKQFREYLELHPTLKESREGKNVFYDAIATAVAIDPSIAVIEPYFVTCETESLLNYGQTIVDWNGRINRKPNVNLARSVNREIFSSMFFEALASYLKEPTVVVEEEVFEYAED